MDGFVALIKELLIEAGVDTKSIHTDTHLELPGYYRPEKKWDLIVIDRGRLIAVAEFKSQVGPSFGNNFNNRTEEAIGSAQDLWTAFREGAFALHRPWLGYLMLLEDCPKSSTAVTVREPHFSVFPEFKQSSYADRYQLFLQKLVLERLYDAACFIPSKRGKSGKFASPNIDLAFPRFATALLGYISGCRAE